MGNFDWMDSVEEKQKEERSKEYFNIVEGENKFFLLSHCAPLAQVWNLASKKYEIATEGTKNPSIKGICWVLQDGLVKSAKLPYTVMKQLRAYGENSEWDLGEFPWKHQVTLSAKNAGTTDVEYTTTLSPKATDIPQDALDELAKKPSPEDIVEKMKAKAVSPVKPNYPRPGEGETPNPDDIPF